MENTAYSEKHEKIKLGNVKFTVIHLTPKMTEAAREDRKKEMGNELYSIFKKYTDRSCNG